MNGVAVPISPDFLVGGGEMGKLIRSMDWSKTPLGPTTSWPQSLRTTVSLCLASNFPISLAWGPGPVQIYNDGYWPICGGKHPNAMGSDFSECWASAWPAIGEAFEGALAGKTSYLENQRMFLDRNGYLEETFFTFSFSPIRDESGGVGGLFHPVTEQTAKMLSERRTRALRDVAARTGKAKSMHDAFALAAETLREYDLDVPFVLYYRLDDKGSRAELVAHAGLAPDRAASAPILDLDAPPPSWPMQEIMRTGCSLQVDGLEARFGPISCGPYPEAPKTAFVSPIFLPGRERAAAVMIAGASARLPLDESYRGFFDLLVGTVAAAVASARAHEDERRQAEALAELDRAKTAFFSNVSHEFRTPLSLLLGPIEDALDGASSDLTQTQRDRLQVAHRNALRLLKLVNTLLDFSRLEAGRAQASYEPIDLARFTAELASSFQSACQKAGLRLVIDCPELPEPVAVDADMWEKIVLNLISNAFKFTLDGEIEVSLRLVEGNRVELAVRDSGIGIADHELPRMFERFHRIENARGRTYEGSGIGLALVHELAKLHGGTIAVESVVDRGSTFKVAIPLGTAHLPADRVRASRTAETTAVGAAAFVEEALRWLPEAAAPDASAVEGLRSDINPQGRARRESLDDERQPLVLLADDNADMRSYVARILKDDGYDVHAVADGETALAAARSGPLPDLVLSDVMMPRLDGFGLLQALRADPNMNGVLVILLSARAGEEARVEGLTAGADDYLIKPFSARELLARVDGAIRLARVRRQAAARERDLLTQVDMERSHAALRDTEIRLNYALAAGKLGAWELDLVTDTSVRSPAHDQIFGYIEPPAEWGYKTFLTHVLAEDVERVQRTFQSAVKRGDTWQVQCRIRREDGETRWIEIQGGPLDSAKGVRATKFIGVVQDISDRVQTEEALKQALKMEAVGQLTGGVAHDFNNLLTVMIGSAELLELSGLERGEVSRLATTIRTAGERAASLTHRLLAFARRQPPRWKARF